MTKIKITAFSTLVPICLLSVSCGGADSSSQPKPIRKTSNGICSVSGSVRDFEVECSKEITTWSIKDYQAKAPEDFSVRRVSIWKIKGSDQFRPSLTLILEHEDKSSTEANI
jgi:hypothetical protein